MKTAITFLLTLFTACIFYAGCSIKKPRYITILAITDSAATTAQIDTAVTVLTKRLQQHGFKNAEVTAQNNQIVIQSAQHDKDWIIDNLLKKGMLTFYECYSIADLALPLQAADKMLAEKEKKSKGTTPENPLFKTFRNIAAPNNGYVPNNIGIVTKQNIPLLKKQFAQTSTVLPADLELVFGKENENAKKEILYAVYCVKNNGKQLTTGNHILKAAAGFDERGKPNMTIEFDAYSASLWQRMTAANINKTIAIVIDGNVLSAPNVISAIEGGKTQISGSFTKEEASTYAGLLGSGYLPVNLVLRSVEAVGKE